jgi:hypothetical protein
VAKSYARLVLAFSSVLAQNSAHAAPQHFQCPDSLPSGSVKIATSAGWKPYVDDPIHLSGVGMTAGPPESMAVLRGEPLNRKGEPESIAYRLVDGFPEGKWLDCYYGDGADLQISKRIDDRFQRCVVAEMKSPARGRRNFDIVCE